MLFVLCFGVTDAKPKMSLYPCHTPFAIESGSALDVSFLLDPPAGKHGSVKVKSDELVFENGHAARFWGVNFAWMAQYPKPEQVGPIVDRLKRFGINMVRLTYLDNHPPRGLVKEMSPDKVILDPEQLDRLDRLVAAFKNAGIYIDAVLMMNGIVGSASFEFTREQVGALQMFHPEIVNAHKRFAEALLTHRNPYTTLTWAEDPALAFLEVYNEGDIFYRRKHIAKLGEQHLAVLQKKWKEWLHEQPVDSTARELSFDVSLLSKPALGQESTSRMQIRFLADLQRNHCAQMRQLIRQCGYQGIICDSAGGAFSSAARWALQDGNLHVAHYYNDHPTFDENGSSIRNRPACESGFPCLLTAAVERDLDRPYVLGEWDFCWPNEYRAEGLLSTAAFASLQRWSGCLQFTYWSGSWDDMEQHFSEGSRLAGVWRIMNDPMVMSLYPAAALLFLRGDVLSCQEQVQIPMETYQVVNWPHSDWRAWQHRYGTIPVQGAGSMQVDEMPVEIHSDTGQVTYSKEKGILIIDSPRTQAIMGKLEGQCIRTEAVEFQLDNSFAVVAVSSLTVEPISKSKRLLITGVSKAQNTGFEVREDNGKSYIVEQGSGPILAEPVGGSIRIKNQSIGTLYGLNCSGQRIHSGIRTEASQAILEFSDFQNAFHYEFLAE